MMVGLKIKKSVNIYTSLNVTLILDFQAERAEANFFYQGL